MAFKMSYENLEDRLKTLEKELEGLREQKRILRKSVARYRNILESVEEGYVETDLAGNLTFVNNAICKISGYSREELIGMNNRDYTSPETARKMFSIFNAVYRTGKPVRISQYEIICKGGRRRSLEMSTSLIRDDEGVATGFRGIVRDISEKVQAETERQSLESRLEQAHRLEAIGTLAGGIAHDFNNLLMGVQGNVSLMLLTTKPEHAHHAKLKNIEQYVRDGSELTRQLLNFALEGKSKTKLTGVNRLIEDTARIFTRTRKNIRIHAADLGSVSRVFVDPGQFKQVLLNLFLNAWHAMPEGGDIYLETSNVILEESYVKPYDVEPGRFVKVSITDTGVGMDAQTLKRSFDPFFTTKDHGRGTGMGLAAAYGIIKNHKGIITAYSEKNHGTTFNIYLPAGEHQDEMLMPAPGAICRGSGNILLIDDEAMIVEVATEMLQELGYRVISAQTGEEGLRLYSQMKSELVLVILDLIMPDRSGGEVYDALKAIDPEVRVLLSSGYSINGEANRVLKKGCNGFIQKPFNVRQLSQKIGEILQSV